LSVAFDFAPSNRFERTIRQDTPQSGEVFLQEHFVPAVLYVQLRAYPVGVYGRAFVDFRKMFSATKKAVELCSPAPV
jgi:hypothetical protein